MISYLENNKRTDALMASKSAGLYGPDEEDDDEEEESHLIKKTGAINVVTIAGTLVNNDSWVNRYLGRTGYPEIRQALIQSAMDPEVEQILLDIKSGGGHVSGVTDTADLIKMIDTKVKPVKVFCDGMMGSAAYWIGSGAREIHIGQVAEVGSIGVLQVVMEQTKMLEMEGLKAHVIKSGELKAVGHPYESLTPAGRAELQSQVDYVGSLFTQAVAEGRGVTYPVANEKMGGGRIFIGQQAVDAGLADSVTTFDAVMSKITQEIDIKKSSSQYGGNFQKGSLMKNALTEQQVAALALAGGLQAGPAADAEAAKAAELAEAAKAAEAAKKAEDEAAAKAAETKPEPVELVTFLKTSLAESQASVMDLTIKLKDATALTEKAGATHAAMRAIAEASVSQLKIALGGTAGAPKELADDALLAEHASLRAQFESKFKAGGVAAVSSSAAPDKESVVDDPVRQARIAATRPAK